MKMNTITGVSLGILGTLLVAIGTGAVYLCSIVGIAVFCMLFLTNFTFGGVIYAIIIGGLSGVGTFALGSFFLFFGGLLAGCAAKVLS